MKFEGVLLKIIISKGMATLSLYHVLDYFSAILRGYEK